MGGPVTDDVEEETYCAAVTDRGDHLCPPSGCEEPPMAGSELCYWHDPDGWAADYADTLAEARRERDW